MIPKSAQIRNAARKNPENGKIELFHFPIFRITRIIRNMYNYKKTALSPFAFLSARVLRAAFYSHLRFYFIDASGIAALPLVPIGFENRLVHLTAFNGSVPK